MLLNCKWVDHLLELELWTKLAQLALEAKNYELVCRIQLIHLFVQLCLSNSVHKHARLAVQLCPCLCRCHSALIKLYVCDAA